MKLPLLSALTEKMKWHQARQSLLAENVANAETPGYKGRDLKAFGFTEHMASLSTAKIETMTTQPTHISVQATGADGFGARDMNSFEVTPEGMKQLSRHQIRAGMPAEVFVRTGERTLLSYLVKPLVDRLNRALTEP